MTEHKSDYASRAAMADRLAGPVPAGYTVYEKRPDIVICDTCIAVNDNVQGLVFREEIPAHEERCHPERIDRTGGFKYFTTLAAAVDKIAAARTNGEAAAAELEVVQAARALLEGWKPFDPAGMDKLIGSMLVMRRMNKPDEAGTADPDLREAAKHSKLLRGLVETIEDPK